VDGDFGGTWVAVNEFGLAACLLNRQDAQAVATRSRGFVIPELIPSGSVADAALVLHQSDLRPYAPFTILLIEPGVPALVADWDGRMLDFDPDAAACMPLVSSSYDSEVVSIRRREEFRRLVPSGECLDAASLYWFHASHGAQPGPDSPCMHRPDAQTVSFSWITVTRREVRFFYSPAAPCISVPGEQQILDRAA